MLRQLLKIFALVLATALMAPLSFAQTPAQPANGAIEAAIKRTLEQRMSDMKVMSIARTTYNGMYEVRTDDNEIFYTDEKVNFLFIGSVRDGQNPGRNLTEERLQKLTAINYKDLPMANSFKMVRGNGRRQIAYFTDPRCPYCRQIDAEFQKLDDVTINVFLYPILSAESAPTARAVWCSKDRAKAWTDLMLSGVQPAAMPAGCDTPIEKNIEFGRRNRLQSVPTVVLTNGVKIAGHRPAAQLNKLIDEAGAAAR
jgi:thiol:disulfide interchange protein DsbC